MNLHIASRYAGVFVRQLTMHIPLRRIGVAAFLVVALMTGSAAGKAGKISGHVMDVETGESLIGVSVYVEGTTQGAISDIDGNYIIRDLEAGQYSLRAQMVGYSNFTVTEVAVTDDEATTVDFSLSPKVLQLDDVVVRAKAIHNTEAVLLKHRQAARSVSDAISAEQIARSGSGDAAEAVKSVVGASVVDGKFVYVRGLGDRYSSTQLNGTPLPSPDPDKQAVPMDLIPANLLDNIVVQKTFTPDKPGSFSGGSVNLGTKEVPDQLTVKFTTSASANSQVINKNNVLTYGGGSKDWLGYDDGKRDLPAGLQDPNSYIPTFSEASKDLEKAVLLNKLSKSLNDQLIPTRRSGPVDQNYAVSYGNRLSLFDKPLGVIGSLSYSRKTSFYDDGFKGEWVLNGHDSVMTQLDAEHELNDTQSKDEVFWGGMLNLAYDVHEFHRLGFSYMRTQNGESVARLLEGRNDEMLGVEDDPRRDARWFTRVLSYTERQMQSVQLRGEHAIKGARVEWNASISDTDQDDPDLRFFSDHYRTRANSSGVDSSFHISLSQYPAPTHYFRELDETNREGRLDITLPFKQWAGHAAKFKLGGSYLRKDRSFREQSFEMTGFDGRAYNLDYRGDGGAFFSSGNVGIDFEIDPETGDTLSWSIADGGVVVRDTDPASQYDGEQNICAVYGMVDLPLSRRFIFVGGARLESTKMDIDQLYQDEEDPTTSGLENSPDDTANIDVTDVLPSVNLICKLSDRMNLRLSYGRTLARPTLRELSGFAAEEFVAGRTFIGNDTLKMTDIDNYDLRWEFFERPGEILAISAFYKKLYNPIELAILNVNENVQPQNVEHGRLYGVEFELRKQLDQLHPLLSNFQFGGNLTLVHSETDIPERELIDLRGSGFYETTRPLQGQSPYIVNLDLTYANTATGTRATVLYNVFGERFAINAEAATPDIYERPRNMLDITVSQKIFGRVDLKGAAKNLFNDPVKFSQEYKGKEYIYESHTTGTSFSIGVTYAID